MRTRYAFAVKQRLLAHIGTFAKYILSGSAAAVVDIGCYFVLYSFGVWYITASVISGVLAFATAFLLHKYVVFRKRESFLRHLVKYFTVDMINLAITTGFLYLLVDTAGMDPRPAKFVALVPVVLWNFFIYKFVVYV